ncbi:MAG: hypothetical protein KIT39_09395 [Nitrospirales bacterium]|nr:hypothetical protein [Nitrospirales bacterium]
MFQWICSAEHRRCTTVKCQVISILKGRRIYIQKILDAKSQFYRIWELLVPVSMVLNNDLRSCNVFNASEFKHCRINHSKFFADTHNQVHDIENSWAQAKRHLQIS